MAKKITVQQTIDAIIARDSGMPYPDVISTFEISPNQFYKAVANDLEELVSFAEQPQADRLRKIAFDPQRIENLFDMGEEFAREQYTAVMEGTQKQFFKGTYRNKRNVERIVYFALISDVAALGSKSREEVISATKGLPTNLQDYFHSIGLAGLMNRAFEEGRQNSPLAVLEVFDTVYQRTTGNKSLFDLDQPKHLHKWGDRFRAPQSYWQDVSNVEEAIWHALMENFPLLPTDSRIDFIETIKELPTNLKDYFNSIGLAGLMMCAFEDGSQESPLAVLKVFDRAYQKRTGDVSLFDLDQPQHLHKWGDNFCAPRNYWRGSANVEEAVWHVFMENLPLEPTDSRIEFLETIKGLPTNLQDYLHSIGLAGLMANAFEEGSRASPLAVLNVFDRAYQKRTGDVSLFDLDQPKHLHKWGDNFQAPRSYWRDAANIEEAVHHTLMENLPVLPSDGRKELIETIKSLPKNLQDYLHSIGLRGLMLRAFDACRKDSPLAVLEVFDSAHQEKTRDKSLFDRNEPEYLEFDGQNRLIR